MQLTVVDPRPAQPPSRLIPLALLVLGAAMLITALGSPPDQRGGILPGAWLWLGIGGVWWWGQSMRHRGANRLGNAWIADLQRTIESMGTETSRLPIVESPIPLRAQETCHWVGEVQWQELRSRTKTIRYSGASISIPIAKGVRYRVGTVTPQRETVTAVETVDEGLLVITSRRLFFDGRERNTTIDLRNLVGVGIDGDCLLVDRANGRDPRLRVVAGDPPIVGAVVLARLLSDHFRGE